MPDLWKLQLVVYYPKVSIVFHDVIERLLNYITQAYTIKCHDVTHLYSTFDSSEIFEYYQSMSACHRKSTYLGKETRSTAATISTLKDLFNEPLPKFNLRCAETYYKTIINSFPIL